ncbi:hypothetical protein [Nonomuraea sp. NPDC049480]|uniref:hypothetical protein n=1 Tax=Nonomuraea sp. NPDC049480 TaxID=3364353 RepID=UPI00379ED7BD
MAIPNPSYANWEIAELQAFVDEVERQIAGRLADFGAVSYDVNAIARRVLVARMRILMTGATGNVGFLVTAARAESPFVQSDVTATHAGPARSRSFSLPVGERVVGVGAVGFEEREEREPVAALVEVELRDQDGGQWQAGSYGGAR